MLAGVKAVNSREKVVSESRSCWGLCSSCLGGHVGGWVCVGTAAARLGTILSLTGLEATRRWRGGGGSTQKSVYHPPVTRSCLLGHQREGGGSRGSLE